MKSDEYTFTNNLPEYELKVDLAKIRESLSFKDNPIEDIRSFKSSSIQSVNELVSVLKIVLSDILISTSFRLTIYCVAFCSPL